MKLWLLRPRDELPREGNPFWPPWYDKMFGFVVRAESEEEARAMAATRAENEGAEAWSDPAHTTCTEVTTEGPAEILIEEFRHD